MMLKKVIKFIMFMEILNGYYTRPTSYASRNSSYGKNIFEEGGLSQDSVVRKFRTTIKDDKNYNAEHYNLDMIISLGYRIKSSIAAQFRQ